MNIIIDLLTKQPLDLSPVQLCFRRVFVTRRYQRPDVVLAHDLKIINYKPHHDPLTMSLQKNLLTLLLGILFQLIVFIFVFGRGVSCCGSFTSTTGGGGGVGVDGAGGGGGGPERGGPGGAGGAGGAGGKGGRGA